MYYDCTEENILFRVRTDNYTENQAIAEMKHKISGFL